MKNSTLETIWLNTEQAAQYLSTTKKAILNLVHKQKLNFYKYGRHNRYRVEDLDALIINPSESGSGSHVLSEVL